jgi:gas vesicle protein
VPVCGTKHFRHTQACYGFSSDRMMGQAREKVTEVKETIKEKVQDAAEQVQKAAEDITNSL